MRFLSRRELNAASVTLLMLFLLPDTSAKHRPDHPYRYSNSDISLSLAAGTVRTPEFPLAVTQWYWIMVQVERPFPSLQMRCMMGATLGPLDVQDCNKARIEPLLQADWKVWDGEKIVAQGSIPNNCACAFTDKYIFRFLGDFPGQSGKKYVVEVKFTKDGTPLNVANPHLIVTRIGYE